jgi:xylan 1,4-beta-xylosidase
MLALALVPVLSEPARAQTPTPVSISVDGASPGAPIRRIWPFYGYDEVNYTTSSEGKALLAALVAANTAPVRVRSHFLFNTGDGVPAMKWGSTNVYTEDASGSPIYDWALTDGILDAITQAGALPFVELGFMPEALSTQPTPYRSSGGATDGGSFYPPKDYGKWAQLIRRWATHARERYPEVEATWLWELWNEPDIGYWKGTFEEYTQLYDFTEAALHDVLPSAALGGPAVAGVASEHLGQFLEHCVSGINAVSGNVGTRLDHVTFHAKGGVEISGDHVRMNLGGQLRLHLRGFKTVAAFEELKQTPIYITEADPDGCAACPVSRVPANAYRTSTAYGAYELAMMKRTLELQDQAGVELGGVLTWAFTFPGAPYFAGFRELSTNGIHLPVMNAFKLLGRLTGARLALTSSGALPLADIVTNGVRGEPEIDGMATLNGETMQVLIWSYHDDLVPSPSTPVHLGLQVPVSFGARVLVSHLRVDETHGNAYTAWLAQGQPERPTAEQRRSLEQAMEPARVVADATLAVEADGSVGLDFDLPRFGVSLITLRPGNNPDDDHGVSAAEPRPTSCACRLGRQPGQPGLVLGLSAAALTLVFRRRAALAGAQLSSRRDQKCRLGEPELGQPVLAGDAQHARTVNEAATHPD